MPAGIVIRAGELTKKALRDGSVTTYMKGSRIKGLSVNVVKEANDKGKFHKYLNGIEGYNNFGVAWLSKLQEHVKIIEDKTDDNPYHCVLQGELSQALKYFTSIAAHLNSAETIREGNRGLTGISAVLWQRV